MYANTRRRRVAALRNTLPVLLCNAFRCRRFFFSAGPPFTRQGEEFWGYFSSPQARNSLKLFSPQYSVVLHPFLRLYQSLWGKQLGNSAYPHTPAWDTFRLSETLRTIHHNSYFKGIFPAFLGNYLAFFLSPAAPARGAAYGGPPSLPAGCATHLGLELCYAQQVPAACKESFSRHRTAAAVQQSSPCRILCVTDTRG